MIILAYVIIAALLLAAGAAIGFQAATIKALSKPPSIPAPIVGNDLVKAIAEATAGQCVVTMKHLLEQPRAYAPGLPDPGREAREAQQLEYERRLRAEFPELAAMIAEPN